MSNLIYQKIKHCIRCCYCIPWVPQLSFDMHKAIVEIFSFLEVIQVIRGRKRSLEGQTLDLLLAATVFLGFPSFRLICIKSQLKYFLLLRSLKFNFILFQEFRILIRRVAKQLEFEPKIKAAPPPYIKHANSTIPNFTKKKPQTLM